MFSYCASKLREMSPWAKCFWAAYFITVALPLHASNNFLSWITIGGSYTYIHIMLLVLLVIACIRSYSSARITLANCLCVVFIFLQCIALFISGAGMRAALSDFGRYLLAILFLVLGRTRRFGKVDLRFFLYLSLIAVFFNCCINVVMNVTQWQVWGLVYFNSDLRTGGGYYNLLVFLIPYALFCLLNDQGKVNLSFFIALVAVAFIGVLYAKSRSTLIVTVIGCLAVLLIDLFNVRSRHFAVHLLEGLVIVAFGFVILSEFISGGSDLAKRFLDMSASLTNNSDTLYTRIITSQYYWDQIQNVPFGQGFGTTMMKLYDLGAWDYQTVAYEIDNAPVTFGYHVGILGLIVYVFMLFVAPIVGVARARDMGNGFKAVLVVCYLMLLFVTGILTSQCIHCYPVVAFVWTFIGLALDKTPFEESEAVLTINPFQSGKRHLCYREEP